MRRVWGEKCVSDDSLGFNRRGTSPHLCFVEGGAQASGSFLACLAQLVKRLKGGEVHRSYLFQATVASPIPALGAPSSLVILPLPNYGCAHRSEEVCKHGEGDVVVWRAVRQAVVMCEIVEMESMCH